ncbi:hypothetical protein [Virgibacillus senegalensis]|uniref:hypothetical protein n=1 Tax=Virgibacillus senegalensis TaxID=1499679 RepID=UPI000A837647|nr:hypothetical protein [Virgibacillus senegalensis]
MLFIISVQFSLDKGSREKTAEEIKQDKTEEKVAEEGKVNVKNGELVIDEEMYEDYFQHNRNEASTDKARELLKRTAMAMNPKGEQKIPEEEKIPSFFIGNQEEMALLHKKNNNNQSGKLINHVAQKVTLLEQAQSLIENKRIKADLSYLVNELTELKFYRIDETGEFIQAYKQYTDLQKKLLEIHYAIEAQ